MARRDALDHWSDVCDRHADLLAFVEFLAGKGVELDTTWAADRRILAPSDYADEYLGVNRKRLDDQRRALLDRQRKAFV